MNYKELNTNNKNVMNLSFTDRGKAHSSIDRLLPMKFDSNPYNIVPKMEPNGSTAPIQAAVSMLTGPDASGDSFERSSGNEGDVQPTEQP